MHSPIRSILTQRTSRRRPVRCSRTSTSCRHGESAHSQHTACQRLLQGLHTGCCAYESRRICASRVCESHILAYAAHAPFTASCTALQRRRTRASFARGPSLPGTHTHTHTHTHRHRHRHTHTHTHGPTRDFSDTELEKLKHVLGLVRLVTMSREACLATPAEYVSRMSCDPCLPGTCKGLPGASNDTGLPCVSCSRAAPTPVHRARAKRVQQPTRLRRVHHCTRLRVHQRK
jgi:hypothetical protein